MASLVSELQTPAGLKPLRAELRRAMAGGELLTGAAPEAQARWSRAGVPVADATEGSQPGTRRPIP